MIWHFSWFRVCVAVSVLKRVSNVLCVLYRLRRRQRDRFESCVSVAWFQHICRNSRSSWNSLILNRCVPNVGISGSDQLMLSRFDRIYGWWISGCWWSKMDSTRLWSHHRRGFIFFARTSRWVLVSSYLTILLWTVSLMLMLRLMTSVLVYLHGYDVTGSSNITAVFRINVDTLDFRSVHRSRCVIPVRRVWNKRHLIPKDMSILSYVSSLVDDVVVLSRHTRAR